MAQRYADQGAECYVNIGRDSEGIVVEAPALTLDGHGRDHAASVPARARGDCVGGRVAEVNGHSFVEIASAFGHEED
jgi:transketolase N-terminal domain/subunit